ncbi:MAG: hypothetical protein KGV50_05355 [Gammaproteobacteria bacterium]|nr:hypothetical protein [Gammaproteobacteria bacterium]
MNQTSLSLCLLLSLSVFANDQLPQDNAITTKIEKTVMAHIGSVACNANLGFTNMPTQILNIPNDINLRKAYLVPWRGDLHCYGGTGSYQGHIALVVVLKNQRAFVIETDILQRNELREINREFLSGRLSMSNHQLRVKSAQAMVPAHTPTDWFYYYIDMSITPDKHGFELKKKQALKGEKTNCDSL